MSSVPAKQELLVKNLPTSHVILYPSRAHISRSIGNVELQPGPNQIEIYGLTPTADEHSIKVDGTGAASITDMTVDLVPNKESFHDAYPDHSDSDQSESDAESDTDSDADEAAVKALRAEIKELNLRLEKAQETGWAADKAMDLFEDYCKLADAKEMDVDSAEKIVDRYRVRRLAKHDELAEVNETESTLRKEINKKERRLRLLTKQKRADDKLAARQAAKIAEKKRRQRDEKAKAKQRLREERLKFWPKKVYRVVIHLDASVDTPTSSRRSSIVSATTLSPELASKQSASENESTLRPISLTLSYVTSDASWSPRYDMTFSTTNKNGSIAYRAEFVNATSETWKDTKVSLSTSQASFRGLDDEVPFMHAWRLGLTKHYYGQGGLISNEEQTQKAKQGGQTTLSGPSRNELFGMPYEPPVQPKKQKKHEVLDAVQRKEVRQQQQQTSFHAVQASPHPSRGAFAQSRSSVPPPPPGAAPSTSGLLGGGLFGSSRSAQLQGARSEDEIIGYSDETATGLAMAVDEMMDPSIEFEDSTYEDHGLTQTYDLPGMRTLEPSSLTRRYKIATLPFTNLVLTSISVPKLRAASFLRARFRNPSSSITLLKGTAGLTLDGTFLGNTTLPRVSPGELITLPLGVDPAVQVSYAKPTVKRSTQGLFNKESAQVFTRSIILTNSKPIAVELLVLDQIPLSEDEKLRIEVLQPRGLSREGDITSTGANAKQGKTEGEKWGKAKATLKKDGEIAYNVALEKGGACRLTVEYEVKTPANEGIVSK